MDLENWLQDHNIPYNKNIQLSLKTWIKTGGTCLYWISPISLEQLMEVCRFLYSNNVKYDIVGQTSNIFFHSTYNPKVVVSTVKVNKYEIEDDVITCDCGVNVVKLAKDCLAKGYARFYGLVGLPGTVASAAVNNASCFNCSISSMLMSADVLQPDGSVRTMMKEDMGYTRRSSFFKRKKIEGIILSVKLRLQRAGNIDEEYRNAETTKAYRKNHQEGYAKNLGSIYANKKKRHNVRNALTTICLWSAKWMGISSPSILQKRLLLLFYGFKDLNHYISDKNINTFVWRDDYAEQAFERYKIFMSKVFKNLEIEIEEKS